jgi:hypothetical protein
MKEQQAVLDFFSKIENLSLGLAVAELMDRQREHLNTQLWGDLQARLNMVVKSQNLPWVVVHTEDRNAPDSLVGLYCEPVDEAAQYLRPMFEQQNLGKGLRIYFGLMWHTDPTPEQLALPAVVALKTALDAQGFKQNERFLAWQWTQFHPRRADFLLRYTQHPAELLDDLTSLFSRLVVETHALIVAANVALANLPRSSVISFKINGK